MFHKQKYFLTVLTLAVVIGGSVMSSPLSVQARTSDSTTLYSSYSREELISLLRQLISRILTLQSSTIIQTHTDSQTISIDGSTTTPHIESGGGSGDASLPSIPEKVTLPNEHVGIADCSASRVHQHLASCVNTLVERKKDSAKLHVVIPEGTYTLNETFFIFAKDNVIIDGDNLPTVTLSPELDRSRGRDQYFIFNIIDSDNVTVQGLSLDGSDLIGQRGFGVCATTDATVDNVKILGTQAHNIRSIYTIVGRSDNEKYFFNRHDLTDGVGQDRFVAYLESHPEVTSCSGDVKNVTFRNNKMWLYNEGFYFTPYASAQTESLSVTPANWRTTAKRTYSGSSDYLIEGNTFTAVTDDLVNFIKMQDASNVIIRDNRFDVRDTEIALAAGAAVNIGSNNQNVTIDANKFIFPTDYKYYSRAINIHSHFSVHDTFGVGDLKIAVPSEDVRVTNNTFYNSGMRVFDCSVTDLYPILTDFALTYDKNPQDNVDISGNAQRGSTLKTFVQLRSVDEADKVAAGSLCRTNLQLTADNN